MVHKSSKKSRRHFKILGVRKATLRKLHAEDTRLLRADAQNLVTEATRCQGYGHQNL